MEGQTGEHAAASSRENRARVYERVLAHIVSSFGPDGAPLKDEASVRAMAASWASTETLDALSQWFRYGARYSGQVTNKSWSFELVYRVVSAMRKDIDPDVTISKNDLMKMIFNDYDATKHDSPTVLSIVLNAAGTVIGP
ncbi:hypothetical protein GCM10009740_40280 [Terrabacter terrae]|uniref:Uncharacterized protein n=1 Tax=Terrabacter terrae TaxID=318434 RepID=A0ABP4KKY4_9MICO